MWRNSKRPLRIYLITPIHSDASVVTFYFAFSRAPPRPPGGSGWIISVGDYADNSFAALGSSDPREIMLEL